MLLRQETQLAPTKAKLILLKYTEEHWSTQIQVQYQAMINEAVATDPTASQPQDISINQSMIINFVQLFCSDRITHGLVTLLTSAQ